MKPLVSNDYDKLRDLFNKSWIIAYPTDTVYGLGVNPMKEDAVRSLNYVKKRNKRNKQYILLVKDMKMLKTYAEVSEEQEKFILSLKGKSVSFILKSTTRIPFWLTDKDKTICFRLASNSFVKEFFEYIDSPIISTSANPNNMPIARDGLEVVSYFEQIRKLVVVPDKSITDNVDEALLVANKPSTIISLIKKPYGVIREGALKFSFEK